ncbi:MAG: pectinesterase family protein [Lachnoclostridium sp.]|nr:pectinesterase family protein [Lachnoclostridium sp.]
MKTFINLLSALMMATPLTAIAAEPVTSITVAADGSGDYTTLTQALRKLRGDMEYDVKIYVKNGVYKEKLVMGASLRNIEIIGENVDSTIITFGDYASLNNMGTSNSYTLKVESCDVTFSNLTFENSAGPVGQAVAVYTTGDCIQFRNCRFLGNQDTLYTGGKERRLYFDNCYIEGTTDFIFGPATALFTDCDIYAKADSYITAASTPRDVTLGYVFYKCNVTAAPGVTKVYLGRPWRPYASTFFIDCKLPAQIIPSGWHNWSDPANELTARYGEYGCTGEGADSGKRVTWAKTISAEDARLYVNPEYIFNRCNTWNPEK